MRLTGIERDSDWGGDGGTGAVHHWMIDRHHRRSHHDSLQGRKRGGEHTSNNTWPHTPTRLHDYTGRSQTLTFSLRTHTHTRARKTPHGVSNKRARFTYKGTKRGRGVSHKRHSFQQITSHSKYGLVAQFSAVEPSRTSLVNDRRQISQQPGLHH